MIDPATIRRQCYALVELESTLYCFFAGLGYLCDSSPDPTEQRVGAGLNMMADAIPWEPHVALVCNRPENACV